MCIRDRAFEGIDALTIDNKGDLIINAALTQLTHLKPIIYQVIDGKRYTREGSFKLAGNTVSFALGDYDTTYPLIIDPLTLSYSTYLGGWSSEIANGIAVDTAGNAYVAGGTFSTDSPTQNPYQGEFGGGGDYGDAFVTKIIDEPNTPPTADITSPLNGSTYYEDDPISFNGSGYDAEDGPLTGSSLVWTSSIDGQIGTGESFIRNDLSVGTHTITLTATDSNGATGSDSVSITVTPGGIH